MAGGAGVNQQHHGQFPFFYVPLYKRLAGTGRHLPVDGSYFVAGLVGAHFVKLHAPAFEDSVIFTGKTVVDQMAGADLDPADFLDKFGC